MVYRNKNLTEPKNINISLFCVCVNVYYYLSQQFVVVQLINKSNCVYLNSGTENN